MPKCKNSPTGTYKGTEPSPKGRGYCAKGEKLNKKMKGNDGKMWIISETKTGVKRWIKFTNNKINSTKSSKKIKGVKKLKPITKNILSPTLLKYQKKTIAKKSKTKSKTKSKNGSISEKLKNMTNKEIKDYLNSLPRYVENSTNYSLWKSELGPNEWYYDNNVEDIISKIEKGGLEKVFKVKIKNNKKNKTYEFIIERKKNYLEYDIVEYILLMSGGENNTEMLIENKKVTKKNFTQMQKDNKYIYVIDNVGQNEIELLISIKGNRLASIGLKKIYKI